MTRLASALETTVEDMLGGGRDRLQHPHGGPMDQDLSTGLAWGPSRIPVTMVPGSPLVTTTAAASLATSVPSSPAIDRVSASKGLVASRGSSGRTS
ncbi:hypothetical protein [Nonomuraea sp. NPDC049784]|uniref:hypothetical protein n=1 Tax=Nonomuraea sp. NPDC049784 TaxID=3154361 RepID=UPI0033CA9437